MIYALSIRLNRFLRGLSASLAFARLWQVSVSCLICQGGYRHVCGPDSLWHIHLSGNTLRKNQDLTKIGRFSMVTLCYGPLTKTVFEGDMLSRV